MRCVLLLFIICPPLFAQETRDSANHEKKVLAYVEKMPEFPGGQNEMIRFLSKKLKYPKEARKAKIQGRVLVKFVIETDGTVSNVEVFRSIHKELDAEAIRVVRMMPRWKPGEQDGKKVRTAFTQPIDFNIAR